MDDLHKRRYERIIAFGNQWDCGDVDALMEHVTDDCVFVASVGPEPGATFTGRDAVRIGFERLLSHDAFARSRSDAAFLAGDWGVALWSYHRDGEGGSDLLTRGCDIFQFRGDKIARKDAYRKVLG